MTERKKKGEGREEGGRWERGKTLEELAWKHHMAIEAVHSNASRDKIKLQTVSADLFATAAFKLAGVQPCSVMTCISEQQLLGFPSSRLVITL